MNWDEIPKGWRPVPGGYTRVDGNGWVARDLAPGWIGYCSKANGLLGPFETPEAAIAAIELLHG